MKKTIIAFIAPENTKEILYSKSEIGLKKILLKFLDQILHKLPTEIEYWVM